VAGVAVHLVTEGRGAAWDPAREREQQEGWDEHAAFMDALAADGFILVGGPVGDGLLVFLAMEAPDDAAVRKRLATDPWMEAEILRVDSIAPWEIRLRGPRDRVPHFAVTRRRGPAWDASRALEEQDDWDGHAAFMDALAAEGAIVLGGPLGDGEKTLLAFDAGDEDEIRAALAGDPWVAARLLELVSIHSWWIRLDGRAKA
jgi:uncharacterized protein YciI